jgi:hypothetical protein
LDDTCIRWRSGTIVEGDIRRFPWKTSRCINIGNRKLGGGLRRWEEKGDFEVSGRSFCGWNSNKNNLKA